ncbi:aquaporin-11-like [Colossoma macropomum]|uniref:aquaporin-11-like n=1 Tax=Colossoma macropomum TaxID=42526 RepID=UPI0018646714|nr:aquaporin-11-like [Colossoma macropomum]
MADLAVSVAVLVGIVLFCEAARRSVKAVFSRGDYSLYLIEVLSTLQLCACSQELKLLGESGRIQPQTGLTLIYLITVVHVSTFHGALCNPSGALELLYRGSLRPSASSVLIACQLSTAWVSRYAASYLWSFGLSDLHLAHKAHGYQCFNPISASLPTAAAVEMTCAFVLQAAVMNIGIFSENLRVHVIAAVITSLAYAGGSITGAVMNPALAFSIQFPCSGHSFLEYAFVFWLGPILGTTSAIAVFEKLIPFLLKRQTYGKKIQ